MGPRSQEILPRCFQVSKTIYRGVDTLGRFRKPDYCLWAARPRLHPALGSALRPVSRTGPLIEVPVYENVCSA